MATGQERKSAIMRDGATLKRLWPARTRSFMARGTFVVFFGLAATAPAFATPPVLPAIAEPASQEHHVGKVVFAELVTPDLAAAERFYGGLFGWMFSNLKFGASEYGTATLDGHPVAGILQKEMPADGHRQPAWLTFIAAANVDATEKLAVENGAKALREPHDVPDRGRQAVLADPQGAVFAVIA